MKLLLIFIALNIVNVILQTFKSIATIKCNKYVASLINAIAYGLYTVVLVYTAMDGITTLEKALIVGLSNLVGVFVVKAIEEKMRKDKLWKIETTILATNVEDFIKDLKVAKISYSHFNINNSDYKLFQIFCPTQKESHSVKELIKKYNAKYFVTETKAL